MMKGFVRGVLVGVGVGLLVAPMTGEEMRRQLGDRIATLRGYLPELIALAANSPFHGGGDTGHAVYRAKLAELLNQGTVGRVRPGGAVSSSRPRISSPRSRRYARG